MQNNVNILIYQNVFTFITSFSWKNVACIECQSFATQYVSSQGMGYDLTVNAIPNSMLMSVKMTGSQAFLSLQKPFSCGSHFNLIDSMLMMCEECVCKLCEMMF